MPQQVWSARENEILVGAAFELREAETQERRGVMERLRDALPGRTRGSVNYKLENVSFVTASLGLGKVPGFTGRPHVQSSLEQEVRRQARARAEAIAPSSRFDVMAIYAGEAARDNLLRGLLTRTWGFPLWDPMYQGQPSIGTVLIASNYSGGSPRVQPSDWRTGTVDVHVCRFVGPFVPANAPHWEDELVGGVIKYPCRFGIEPISFREAVNLDVNGPLGSEVAEAVRRSSSHRGMGKLVARWDADGLIPDAPGLIGPNPSGAPMTEDLPASGKLRGTGPGRMSDAAMRNAIESRSMGVVKAHYENRGWLVVDTSSDRPWDFEATRGREHIRIEVKGTTGLGTHVQLTAGEVRNAMTFPRCALAVVSDIELRTSSEGITAAGGRLRLIDNWSMDPADLRSLTYEYRVPD